MKVDKEKRTLSTTDIQKAIQPILWKYPIKSASIFGSYARHEARPDSDIDILVEFSATIGLIQFVNIQLELEDKLGKKVDLVELSTLKPQLKANILKDQIAIIEDSKKSILFSENAKSRFLERISSDDEKIKQLVYAYLSCQSIKEQEGFLNTVPSKYLETFTKALQEIATWYPSNVPNTV